MESMELRQLWGIRQDFLAPAQAEMEAVAVAELEPPLVDKEERRNQNCLLESNHDSLGKTKLRRYMAA